MFQKYQIGSMFDYLLETVSPLLHRSNSLLCVCTQTPLLLLAISKSRFKEVNIENKVHIN